MVSHDGTHAVQSVRTELHESNLPQTNRAGLGCNSDCSPRQMVYVDATKANGNSHGSNTMCEVLGTKMTCAIEQSL